MLDNLFRSLIRIKARIGKKIRNHISKEKAYIKKLLFPLKLFPLKLIIYFFYYPMRISVRITIWLIKSFFKMLIWPFRKWSNFFKTIVWVLLLTYLFFTFVVIVDYLARNYGNVGKFWCGVGLYEDSYNDKVVRIIGGYGQGSGFFIAEDQVLTNFHVVADEPSPKIVFPGGKFITPYKIIGSRDYDLAVLYTKEKYPDLIFKLMNPTRLSLGEPVLSVGYALGTEMQGNPTRLNGKFIDFRGYYLQSDINLVSGMSGGPLVDKCGTVVGVNTSGISGMSMFISSTAVNDLMPTFTDQDIKKIVVDTSTPEGSVKSFYTYLKARNMEEGFKLLSSSYLTKTNFDEWTNRFNNILDVEIFLTKLEDKKTNTVYIKFGTQNWVSESIQLHYYQGTWETVLEDGDYKMNRSNIEEIYDPDWTWFYE